MKTEPTEALKEIKRCSWEVDFEISDGLESYEVVDKDDAINIANIAFKEGQSSPKIKQLEWVETYEDGVKRIKAKIPFGNYEVYEKRDHDGYILWWFDPTPYAYVFDTEMEAKMYAQTNFEKRVMGCLDLKVLQKQRLINMMRWDEEIGLYDDNPKNH